MDAESCALAKFTAAVLFAANRQHSDAWHCYYTGLPP